MASDNKPHVESASDLAARFRAEMENRDFSPTVTELLAEQLLSGDNTAISKLVEMGPEHVIAAMDALEDLLAMNCPLTDFDSDGLFEPGLPSDDLVLVEFEEVCMIPLPPPPDVN
jgi:hypothetical protein